MLVTICTIRQLPQAFALANSFVQYAATNKPASVLIGLADDPAHLPAGFVSPYPLLPIRELLSDEQLTTLSAIYTPTEFAAACKPLLVAEAFRRYPDTDSILYADPNIQFLAPLTPVWEQLSRANVLLTPFITQNPHDTYWPDEKFFQNVGLYSADFLALRRSPETDRLLAWWDDRVRERAYVDFCAGLCLDQIWLMHVPVFFKDTVIVRNPGWHVALWNLPERVIRQERNGWWVDGPAGQNQPLLFLNGKGLLNPDEGFFPHQSRFHLADRTEVSTILTQYRQSLSKYADLNVRNVHPAYGKKPEPMVLRGWRYATVNSLRAITRFLDQVPLPVIR
ncbi:hypothetical protein [Spirosoma validum]|uniref:Glycosyl transferase n=1 Tax=Spirosoma validum TaxID=2771355 RepID=A0A927B743_9BACT|nr:hypothetical protein [Spirosoma validum]MBD2756599.1 hypothetical protein [Spirosoma validum]